MPAASNAAAQSQAAFRSSPYEDSSWEIVGQAPRAEEFYPMSVGVLPSTASSVDPMFADFGGNASTQSKELWHLPQHLAQQMAAGRREEQDTALRIEPEELERIKQEAFEAGRVQGVEQSVGAQTEKMSMIEQRILQVLKDLQTQQGEIMSQLTHSAGQLAVQIARKIIDGAVDINPEYIVRIIQEALKLAGGAAVKKVRVSKQDLEFIEVIGVPKMLKEFDGSWAFEQDPTIRAGCVVETSAGEIDFDLDRAWERVRENVIKVAS